MVNGRENVIRYAVVCVSEFANRHGLSQKDAYNYLQKYKGIEFLKIHYEIEHTLSFEDAVDDLTLICKKNGGNLS